MKSDIFAPYPIVSMVCWASAGSENLQKSTLNQGGGGLYILWLFLLFCQTFMTRIVAWQLGFVIGKIKFCFTCWERHVHQNAKKGQDFIAWIVELSEL